MESNFQRATIFANCRFYLRKSKPIWRVSGPLCHIEGLLLTFRRAIRCNKRNKSRVAKYFWLRSMEMGKLGKRAASQAASQQPGKQPGKQPGRQAGRQAGNRPTDRKKSRLAIFRLILLNRVEAYCRRRWPIIHGPFLFPTFRSTLGRRSFRVRCTDNKEVSVRFAGSFFPSGKLPCSPLLRTTIPVVPYFSKIRSDFDLLG